LAALLLILKLVGDRSLARFSEEVVAADPATRTDHKLELWVQDAIHRRGVVALHRRLIGAVERRNGVMVA